MRPKVNQHAIAVADTFILSEYSAAFLVGLAVQTQGHRSAGVYKNIQGIVITPASCYSDIALERNTPARLSNYPNGTSYHIRGYIPTLLTTSLKISREAVSTATKS